MTPSGETRPGHFLSEAYAALAGCWLLARRQPVGLALFNATAQGFWRSFWAVAIAIAADTGLEALAGQFDASHGGLIMLAAVLIGRVMDAAAFPLVTARIADELGRGPRWVLFVVAYNWAGLLAMAVNVPANLLVLAVPSLAPFVVGVEVALLVYEAYVVHRSLDVSPFTAGGIVLLDELLYLVINTVARHLGGA